MTAMTLQQFFTLGMKRECPALLEQNKYTTREGFQINLGCGNSPMPGLINLDFPEWNGEDYVIHIPNQYRDEWIGSQGIARDVLVRCPDECVDVIYAFHFLEHLRDPRRMMREIQRVLRPGGIANIVVPHYSGSIAYEDLDHKAIFAIDTWSNMLKQDYYMKDRKGWKLRIHFNMMMAIAERNAAVFTQFVREA